MPNIKFSYLYRDSGNYKTFGYVVFPNPEKLPRSEIETVLKAKLIDEEFFDPRKLKLTRLVHAAFGDDPELDHSWNEFECIEETDEPASDSRSIKAFLMSL
jgi:hypothetical protein